MTPLHGDRHLVEGGVARRFFAAIPGLRRRRALWRAELVRIVTTSYVLFGFSAVLGVLTARLLGPAERGAVSSVLAWCGLLTEAGSLGVAFGLTYALARGSTRAVVRRVSDWFMVRQIIATMAVGILLFLLAFSDDLQRLALPYVFVFPFMFLVAYRIAELLGVRRIGRWNAARSLGAALPSVGGLVFALGSPHAGPVLLGYAVGAIIAGIVAHILTGPLPTPEVGAAEDSPSRLRRELFRFGSRTALGGVLSSSNRYLDIAIMALILPREDVGLYSAAVSLAALMLPLGAAIGADAFSRLPKLSPSEQRDLSIRATRRATVVLSLTALVGAFAAGPVLDLTFGESFLPATTAARILFPAGALLGLVELRCAIARGLGHPMHTVIGHAAGLIVTLSLLPVTLPRFGIAGAAWTSLGSYALTLAVLIVLEGDRRRRAGEVALCASK